MAGLFRRLEAVVHAGEAAVRLIAGYIDKFTFLLACGAGLRRCRLHDGIAAVAAFPGVFRKIRFGVGHGLPPFYRSAQIIIS